MKRRKPDAVEADIMRRARRELRQQRFYQRCIAAFDRAYAREKKRRGWK